MITPVLLFWMPGIAEMAILGAVCLTGTGLLVVIAVLALRRPKDNGDDYDDE